MPDVGWGELLLLAVVALLIFGPDKLPRAARDAGRMMRKLREMSQSAQQEISSHGVDVQGIKDDLRGVADLHPKRIIRSAMEPLENSGRPTLPGASTTDPTAPMPIPPASVHDAPSAADSAPGSPAPRHSRLDPDAT